MAFAVRETTIANPATGRGKARKKMAARHLSAKQIKAGFGGKRRQGALKAKRHTARTRPTVKKVRRASPRPKPVRKRNLGEIVSILLPGMAGNPATKRGKTMAARKKHKKRATAQRTAGSRRTTKKLVVHHRRRTRNPGMGKAGEFVKLGAAVVGGAVGSKVATQVVLGAKNSSWLGYAGNLVATFLLGWGASVAFKDKIIAQGVIGGGIAQVIVRVIGEQTPYGSYLSGMPGVGDYQVSKFLAPQRMVNALRSAALEQPSFLAPPAAVVVTHPATAAAGVGQYDWN